MPLKTIKFRRYETKHDDLVFGFFFLVSSSFFPTKMMSSSKTTHKHTVRFRRICPFCSGGSRAHLAKNRERNFRLLWVCIRFDCIFHFEIWGNSFFSLFCAPLNYTTFHIASTNLENNLESSSNCRWRWRCRFAWVVHVHCVQFRFALFISWSRCWMADVCMCIEAFFAYNRFGSVGSCNWISVVYAPKNSYRIHTWALGHLNDWWSGDKSL